MEEYVAISAQEEEKKSGESDESSTRTTGPE